MTLSQHIRSTLEMPTFVVTKYLEDLDDGELLVRPLPSMNHIAWQLGHLITSEHSHINQVCPDGMPVLPVGFADEYTKATATSDEASQFRSKDEYLALMHQQRKGTLELLDGLSDDDLRQPSPESIRYFGPTVGSVFAGESAHWMMHVGQWAVIRRKLGKPPLF